MSDAPPAPPRLRAALTAHEEVKTKWVRPTWEKTLPGHESVLSQLKDAVSRADVFLMARELETERQALDLFVASMVWGHGKNGYGAWRTARVLQDPAAGSKLLEAARVTRQSGGCAGFNQMAGDRLKYLGVAFATKYLFFCGPGNVAEQPLVLDAVVQRWLSIHAGMWLSLDWNKNDYRKYLTCVAAWADELGEDPATLEESMFRDKVAITSQFASEAGQDAAHLLDELEEVLTALPNNEEKHFEARGHLDALRELLKSSDRPRRAQD